MDIDMENFTLEVFIAQAKAAQLKKEANAEKLPALFDKTLDALVAACKKLEAITAERDQLAERVKQLNKNIEDFIIHEWREIGESEWYSGTLDFYFMCKNSPEHDTRERIQSLKEIKAKAICDFKDELLAATSVMFRPHIEGVCAVVTERMQAAKDGAA
ncbi:hypothetical protein [Shewanella decolorationis]|uniref:hypothetical protein n=1 Tax=Shewanella decolorationis TaxID=256839 RepID=UPI001057328D|nr:hypothetical protein [Shewanella decolorationis]